jgi:hypothetical protein
MTHELECRIRAKAAVLQLHRVSHLLDARACMTLAEQPLRRSSCSGSRQSSSPKDVLVVPLVRLIILQRTFTCVEISPQHRTNNREI